MPLNTVADWQSQLADTWMLDVVKNNQIPGSLEELWGDEAWYTIFYYFVQQEFSHENLDFLRTVETFQGSGDLGLAKQIYDEFVSTQAPRQVNVGDAERAPLDAAFGPAGDGVAPPNVLDAAYGVIMKLVARDTFRRFKDSVTRAQEALAAPVDWDNLPGRERAAAVVEDPPPPPATPTFMEAMDLPEWWQAFEAYCATEYTQENPEFLDALRSQEPRAIYDTFIVGEKEINISAALKSAIVAAFADGATPGVDVFDGARDQVIGMLSGGTWPRYVASLSAA